MRLSEALSLTLLTLLAGCRSSSPAAPSLSDNALDGLYRAHREDDRHYLRFLPDNTVAEIVLMAEPEEGEVEEVVRCFHRLGRRGFDSTYTVCGRTITFSLEGAGSRTDFEGEMRGNSLSLRSYAHHNDTRRVWQFELVPLDFQTLWPPSDMLLESVRAKDPRVLGGVVYPLLLWTPADTAAWYNVYFGTEPGLDEANLVGSHVDEPVFPYDGILKQGVTYYWRVDAVERNGQVIHKGDVWSFTTSESAVEVRPNTASVSR